MTVHRNMWQEYANGLNLSILQHVFFSLLCKVKTEGSRAKEEPISKMFKIAQS